MLTLTRPTHRRRVPGGWMRACAPHLHPGDNDLAGRVEVGRNRDFTTSRGFAQSSCTAARSRPISAAIAPCPGGQASCIRRPRSRTARNASPKRQRAGGNQRAVLAQAMTGGQFRRDRAFGFERAQCRDRGRERRRLGVRSQAQVLLGTLEAHPRERETERLVGLFERPAARPETLAKSAPIPTFCDPSGKQKATFIVDSNFRNSRPWADDLRGVPFRHRDRQRAVRAVRRWSRTHQPRFH